MKLGLTSAGLAVFLIAAFIGVTAGLKCYTCKGDKGTFCSENEVMDCSDVAPVKNQPTACYKGFLLGLVIRSCGPKAPAGCSGDTCICDTDKCNGAMNNKAMNVLTFSTLLVVILKMFL